MGIVIRIGWESFEGKIITKLHKKESQPYNIQMEFIFVCIIIFTLFIALHAYKFIQFYLSETSFTF